MILFSDCMSHTLTILDDIEMYEKHKPFALGNFVTLSTVINQFLFKAIWSNLILDTGSPLFISLHSLLRYVQFLSHLNNYFDFHVCLSFRPPSVRLSVFPKTSSNACSSITN